MSANKELTPNQKLFLSNVHAIVEQLDESWIFTSDKKYPNWQTIEHKDGGSISLHFNEDKNSINVWAGCPKDYTGSSKKFADYLGYRFQAEFDNDFNMSNTKLPHVLVNDLKRRLLNKGYLEVVARCVEEDQRQAAAWNRKRAKQNEISDALHGFSGFYVRRMEPNDRKNYVEVHNLKAELNQWDDRSTDISVTLSNIDLVTFKKLVDFAKAQNIITSEVQHEATF